MPNGFTDAQICFYEEHGCLVPNEGQINFYHKNGYLVLEGAFSDEECDTLLALLKQYADENFGAMLQIDWQVSEVRDRVRGVMDDSRVVPVLETLQGMEVDGLMTQVLFKEVGTAYAAQSWNPHQDNSYPQAPLGCFITINLFLEDADRENGCLFLYPGSHKEGLLEYTPTISYREQPGERPGNKVEIPSLYEGKEIDVVVKKGGYLVLHGEMIHGSHPNVSPTRSRPVFQATYVKRGVSFFEGRNAKRTRISLKNSGIFRQYAVNVHD